VSLVSANAFTLKPALTDCTPFLGTERNPSYFYVCKTP